MAQEYIVNLFWNNYLNALSFSLYFCDLFALWLRIDSKRTGMVATEQRKWKMNVKSGNAEK